MGLVRNILLGAVAALGLALPVVAAERAIIVLDGSGSMWAQIDGKARITIARETLASVLSTLPDDLELGFMTYGHRTKGDCADIEMLVEPAAGTGPAITAAAEAINPKGMTPISDAVRLAAEDLRFTEQKATVILITDGLETCEVDPCQLATDLEAQGIDFTTHVLGFGLSDDEGQQVACLAENTGGKYLSASDGAALVEALSTTVAQVVQAEATPAPEPAPQPAPEPIAVDYTVAPTASLSEGGPDLLRNGGIGDIYWKWFRVNADGSKGEEVDGDYYAETKMNIEPGDYIMRAELGYAFAEQPITVEAGKVITPHFMLDGTILELSPRPGAGQDVDENADIEIRHDDTYLATEYGTTLVVVPAGETTLIVGLGEASLTESFTAVAGSRVVKDLIVSVGVAKITSEYVEGMAVDADIYVEVFKAKKSIDGTRESVTYGYGGEQQFDLPPGDYVLTYDLGGATGEVPFTVKASELVEVVNVMDAGVLAVTTPTDDYVEIRSATKDIQGNATSFDYGYGPEFQTTLAAGEYVVHTEKNGAESDTPITIVEGERFELTVEPNGKAGKKK